MVGEQVRMASASALPCVPLGTRDWPAESLGGEDPATSAGAPARRHAPSLVVALVICMSGCGLDAVGPDLDAFKTAQAAATDGAQGGADSDDGTVDGGDSEIGGDGDAEVDGGCQEAKACDDGDPCTTDDGCKGNVCAGAPKSCADDNLCTSDSCSSDGACVHFPLSVGACDDGDACTTGDVCKNGACQLLPLDCGDGNACTSDACDKGKGCVHLPMSATCTDGDACTLDDCAAGACATTGKLTCDDGAVCTKDSCEAATGCTHTPLSAATACDDGSACTVLDACKGGACVGIDPAGPRHEGQDIYGQWVAAVEGAEGALAIGSQAVGLAAAPQPAVARLSGPQAAKSTSLINGLPPATRFRAAATPQDAAVGVEAVAIAGKDNNTVTLLHVRLLPDAKLLQATALDQPIGTDAAAILPLLPADSLPAAFLFAGAALVPDKASGAGATVSRARVWRRDVDGGLAPVAIDLPPASLRALGNHPRGAFVAGWVQGDGASRPAAGVLDRAGRLARWQWLEENGQGVVQTLVSHDVNGALAGGGFGVGQAGHATWWRLDVQGRVLARGQLPALGPAEVIAGHPLGHQRAMLLVHTATGAPRALRIGPQARMEASWSVLGPGDAPAALVPTTAGAGIGWWVVGRQGGKGGFVPGAAILPSSPAAGAVPRAEVRHGWFAAGCSGVGACAVDPLQGCDDGLPCTDDVCEKGPGCLHIGHTDVCLDGQACAVGAKCAPGGCQGGKPRLFAVVAPAERFSKRTPAQIVADSDGGATALITGLSKSAEGYATLVRFDAAGKAQWSEVIQTLQPFDLALATAAPGTPEPVVLVGQLQVGGTIKAAAQRHGPDGALVWTKFPVTAKFSGWQAALRDGAHTLAAGVHADEGAQQFKGHLALIGADGALAANVIVPLAKDAESMSLTALGRIGNGSVVVAGVETTAQGTFATVLRLSPALAPLARRRLGLQSTANFALPVRLLSLDHGLLGVRREPPTGSQDVTVLEPVALALQQTLPLVDAGSDAALQLLRLHDGAVAAVGTPDGKSAAAFVVGVGGPSTPLFSQEIPGAIALAAGATVLTSGDLFVVAQATTGSDQILALTARVAPSGATECLSAGACGQSPARRCDAGTPCAIIACSAATCGGGKPVTACLGPPCIGGGLCTGGLCDGPSNPLLKAACDDGNPCTLDVCDPGLGCSSATLPDATPCDDGKACSAFDACEAGVCVGAPPNCP